MLTGTSFTYPDFVVQSFYLILAGMWLVDAILGWYTH